MSNKGFTLVELLIVIAILGVLSAAVVLVLNPAELLKQARDSTRASDMATMNSALSLYLTDVASPNMSVGVLTCATSYFSGADDTTNPFAGGQVENVSSSQSVTGIGWLPINFGLISGGSPLGVLPVDPTNSGDLVYRYACNDGALTYELNSQFESAKYLTTLNLDGKDGGDQATFYEIGNDPGLDL